MHAIVLFLDIIKVFSMLVNSERAEHMFQQKESVVILMFNAWGVVEDSDVRVVHFIVTHEHEGGNIYILIQVSTCSSCSLAYGLEGVVNLINKLLVVYVTSSNNN